MAKRERSAFSVLFHVAAALAILLAVGLAAARPATAGDAAGDKPEHLAPYVTAAIGEVEVRADGIESWTPVTAGAPLQPGDTLRTGARSKAEVAHPLGVIRLFEHTVLRLPMESDGRVRWVRRPELSAGQALFDVVPSRIGSLLSLIDTRVRHLFEVSTPNVVSGVKGTRFAVIERGARSVVAVYEGRVVTSGAAGAARDTVLLTWGQLAEYRDGRLTGVGSFDYKDDWARWARPAVHRPSVLDGAGGGGSGPVRESGLLDGGTATVTSAASAIAPLGALPGTTTAGTTTLIGTTLSGPWTITASDGSVAVTGDFTLASGVLSGSATVPDKSMTFLFSGTGTADGSNIVGLVTFTDSAGTPVADGTFNITDGVFNGTATTTSPVGKTKTYAFTGTASVTSSSSTSSSTSSTSTSSTSSTTVSGPGTLGSTGGTTSATMGSLSGE